VQKIFEDYFKIFCESGPKIVQEWVQG